MGRQDGGHADRLTQTWGKGGKGVQLGFRLRDRVGDTINRYLVWCAGKGTERRQTLTEY